MISVSSCSLGKVGRFSWKSKNLLLMPPANLSSHLYGPNYSRRDASASDQIDSTLKLGSNSKAYGFIGKGWIPERCGSSVREEKCRMQNGAATGRALYNEPTSDS